MILEPIRAFLPVGLVVGTDVEVPAAEEEKRPSGMKSKACFACGGMMAAVGALVIKIRISLWAPFGLGRGGSLGCVWGGRGLTPVASSSAHISLHVLWTPSHQEGRAGWLSGSYFEGKDSGHRYTEL